MGQTVRACAENEWGMRESAEIVGRRRVERRIHPGGNVEVRVEGQSLQVRGGRRYQISSNEGKFRRQELCGLGGKTGTGMRERLRTGRRRNATTR